MLASRIISTVHKYLDFKISVFVLNHSRKQAVLPYLMIRLWEKNFIQFFVLPYFLLKKNMIFSDLIFIFHQITPSIIVQSHQLSNSHIHILIYVNCSE